MRSKLLFGILPLLFVAICAAAPQTTLDTDPLISVDIESSRSQLVAGEGLGVSARIKNISKSTVYLRETSFALTLPLEMEGKRGSVSGYSAYFPTEFHKGNTYEEFHKNTLKLNPGDTYSAFWTNTFSDNPSPSQASYILELITTQFQFLFFYPGKYSITLTAKYWTDPAFPEEKYRTLTKNITLPIVAPLFVILFGAALSGLIAYFILPQTISQSRAPKPVYLQFLRRIAGMAGSALVSVIVTIVLSRVSETQFLISVTVNDVWGAIVMGFAANYAGYKVLEKLLVPSTGSNSNRNTVATMPVEEPPLP